MQIGFQDVPAIVRRMEDIRTQNVKVKAAKAAQMRETLLHFVQR